ncbi:MAG: hypothetical protein EOO50_03535 [Flavobacterium sp.]|uniref:lipopolysaccharide biosynthesis protein n=1 Tax=Flavobacterium sp. TaxID=239 RepID=UPI0011FD875C|nr:oligosaccharide flippase family protein [Flavobacterium sp.]RZJ67906.1 MAG: hypothetical protein EOO50_03535 [Flavobacterium sp.]
MAKTDGIYNKKKLSDLLVYGFGQGFNLLGPLLVIPHLISICGQDGLGRIGVGFAMALTLNGIIDYGSYINGVRDISINREDPNYVRRKFHAIYFSKFLLLLAVTAVMTVLIFTVPYFSKDKPLFFLSFAVVLGQFISPAWFFQGIENFAAISFANILSKILYIAGVFLFVLKPDDYIYANLFFGIGTIVANLLIFLFAVRKVGMIWGKTDIVPALEILKGEFSFSFSQFFLSIYQFFPIMVISYLGGDFMAGEYRVIDQVVSIFKSYLTLFFYFSYSGVCFAINADLRKGIKVWFQYHGANLFAVLVLLAIFYLKAELLFTFFKIDAASIPEISHYFRIALCIPLIIAFSLPLRQLMFAFEKNRIYITMTIAATVFNVGLLFALTKWAGLQGALFSIAVTEFIVVTLYLVILNRYFTKALKIQ